MIQAHFEGYAVFSNASDAFSLQEKSAFGEKKRNKVEYMLAEALYLVDTKKMHVHAGKKQLDFDALLRKARRVDKRIDIKYPVYANLRKNGYIIKTALKFGAEFRVYDKGIKPGQDHSLWLIYPVKEHEIHTWHDFAAKNRVAHSARKKLLLGIVDDEDDVTYYEVGWLKP